LPVKRQLFTESELAAPGMRLQVTPGFSSENAVRKGANSNSVVPPASGCSKMRGRSARRRSVAARAAPLVDTVSLMPSAPPPLISCVTVARSRLKRISLSR
jgi:hypothetical protein